MFNWAAVFFILAMIFCLLAFGGIATAGAIGVAKVLFFIFLVAFVVSLLMGLFSTRETF